MVTAETALESEGVVVILIMSGEEALCPQGGNTRTMKTSVSTSWPIAGRSTSDQQQLLLFLALI